ncbi:hypothetical protein [Desulfopila aestuarii]|nr:hypothetical protein [Desulfopila aestuarii]
MVRTNESIGDWLVKQLKGAMAKKLDAPIDIWLYALSKASESR